MLLEDPYIHYALGVRPIAGKVKSRAFGGLEPTYPALVPTPHFPTGEGEQNNESGG